MLMVPACKTRRQLLYLAICNQITAETSNYPICNQMTAGTPNYPSLPLFLGIMRGITVPGRQDAVYARHNVMYTNSSSFHCINFVRHSSHR
ncbi:hypothetical protein M430DRAFT_229007 [Amorphotheca resinae ATCC 22711]|uniref:Uncharacterized protein n=1 Tax=Amorphotheca resinae ATCC 22711 TaxID=857342 RepID=A0A2T3B372_AMORE|nr:hypothetical protein M430DRAFT_229007 [Amorphotheca resinae ATCC 22711]PSS20075.1 hypothetical protein M430DRAFT_229007 [Amorphotheca resinae ATCC 22711]